jgi:hypothetical protein
MKLSANRFILTTPVRLPEIKETLRRNTLTRKVLIKEKTDKLFIGKIEDDGFYLVSAAPKGILCTLKGSFEAEGKDTRVEIQTKIHKAFIALFVCWLVFIIAIPTVTYILHPGMAFPYTQLGLIVVAIIVAWCLLYFVYTRTRDKSIKELETLIIQ